jgi:putative component of toxin-antitoxin plasmid stabilization module
MIALLSLLIRVELELHDEISEWMDTLSKDDWDRTFIVIERLASDGFNARMPFSRALGEGLFELRFTLGSTARRVTYRFTTDQRIILLTTFRKQRNNERSEITRARAIAADCARQNP